MIVRPDASGPRVGINLEVPQFTLHVNGNGFFEGDLTVEGELTATLAAGSVGASALAFNSVGSPAIENNSITSDDIANGAITVNDLDLEELDDIYVNLSGAEMTGALTAPNLRASLVNAESIVAETGSLAVESAGDLEVKLDRNSAVANATFRVSNSAGQSVFALEEAGDASVADNLTVGGILTTGGPVAVGGAALDDHALLQLNLPPVATFPHLRLQSPLAGLGFGLRFVNPNATWTVGPNLDISNENRFHIMSGVSNQGLVVATNGNIGIGDLTDASPFAKLTVDGTIGFPNVASPMMFVYPSGTANPAKPVIVHSPNFPGYGLYYRDDGDRFTCQSSPTDATPSLVVDLDSNWVTIAAEVGKPGYELSVNGQIVCEDLLIEDSANWPDYVFAENYRLKSLAEVESHIEQFRHLPGTPTAEDVDEHGITVGAMQRMLMEKIEELTLYAIQQDKRIARQEQRLRELETRIAGVPAR
jgi:hypothetical protein